MSNYQLCYSIALDIAGKTQVSKCTLNATKSVICTQICVTQQHIYTHQPLTWVPVWIMKDPKLWSILFGLYMQQSNEYLCFVPNFIPFVTLSMFNHSWKLWDPRVKCPSTPTCNQIPLAPPPHTPKERKMRKVPKLCLSKSDKWCTAGIYHNLEFWTKSLTLNTSDVEDFTFWLKKKKKPFSNWVS